jgi:hypothetical protein
MSPNNARDADLHASRVNAVTAAHGSPPESDRGGGLHDEVHEAGEVRSVGTQRTALAVEWPDPRTHASCTLDTYHPEFQCS